MRSSPITQSRRQPSHLGSKTQSPPLGTSRDERQSIAFGLTARSVALLECGFPRVWVGSKKRERQVPPSFLAESVGATDGEPVPYSTVHRCRWSGTRGFSLQ